MTRIKSQSNKEITYLKYQSKTPFSYSKAIDADFLEFKSPLFVRAQIKTIINRLTEDLVENENLIDHLKRLILYCPIMMPYIMFHPINVKGKADYDSCESFLDYIVKCASKEEGTQAS